MPDTKPTKAHAKSSTEALGDLFKRFGELSSRMHRMAEDIGRLQERLSHMAELSGRVNTALLLVAGLPRFLNMGMFRALAYPPGIPGGRSQGSFSFPSLPDVAKGRASPASQKKTPYDGPSHEDLIQQILERHALKMAVFKEERAQRKQARDEDEAYYSARKAQQEAEKAAESTFWNKVHKDRLNKQKQFHQREIRFVKVLHELGKKYPAPLRQFQIEEPESAPTKSPLERGPQAIAKAMQSAKDQLGVVAASVPGLLTKTEALTQPKKPKGVENAKSSFRKRLEDLAGTVEDQQEKLSRLKDAPLGDLLKECETLSLVIRQAQESLAEGDWEGAHIIFQEIPKQAKKYAQSLADARATVDKSLTVPTSVARAKAARKLGEKEQQALEEIATRPANQIRLDTETTDIDPTKAFPLEITAHAPGGKKFQKHVLPPEDVAISPGAQAVHALQVEGTGDARTLVKRYIDEAGKEIVQQVPASSPQEAAKELLRFLAENLPSSPDAKGPGFAGANFKYDVSVLENFFAKYLETEQERQQAAQVLTQGKANQGADTLEDAKKVFGLSYRPSEDKVAELLGVDVSPFRPVRTDVEGKQGEAARVHDAAGDVNLDAVLAAKVQEEARKQIASGEGEDVREKALPDLGSDESILGELDKAIRKIHESFPEIRKATKGYKFRVIEDLPSKDPRYARAGTHQADKKRILLNKKYFAALSKKNPALALAKLYQAIAHEMGHAAQVRRLGGVQPYRQAYMQDPLGMEEEADVFAGMADYVLQGGDVRNRKEMARRGKEHAASRGTNRQQFYPGHVGAAARKEAVPDVRESTMSDLSDEDRDRYRKLAETELEAEGKGFSVGRFLGEGIDEYNERLAEWNKLVEERARLLQENSPPKPPRKPPRVAGAAGPEDETPLERMARAGIPIKPGPGYTPTIRRKKGKKASTYPLQPEAGATEERIPVADPAGLSIYEPVDMPYKVAPEEVTSGPALPLAETPPDVHGPPPPTFPIDPDTYKVAPDREPGVPLVTPPTPGETLPLQEDEGLTEEARKLARQSQKQAIARDKELRRAAHWRATVGMGGREGPDQAARAARKAAEQAAKDQARAEEQRLKYGHDSDTILDQEESMARKAGTDTLGTSAATRRKRRWLGMEASMGKFGKALVFVEQAARKLRAGFLKFFARRDESGQTGFGRLLASGKEMARGFLAGIQSMGQKASYGLLGGVSLGASLVSQASPDAFALVTGSFQLLAAQLGTVLVPATVELAARLQGMAASFQSLDPAWKKFVGSMFKWSMVSLAAIAVGSRLISALSSLVISVSQAAAGMIRFAYTHPAATTALTGLAIAMVAGAKMLRGWAEQTNIKDVLEKGKGITREEYEASDEFQALKKAKAKGKLGDVATDLEQDIDAQILEHDKAKPGLFGAAASDLGFSDALSKWKETAEKLAKKKFIVQQGASEIAGGTAFRPEEQQNKRLMLLTMARSTRNQVGYSSVEEAYKKVQVAALEQDPLQQEILKIQKAQLEEMMKTSGELGDLKNWFEFNFGATR